MSSKNGKLIVFSAPSGSGKTTLVRYLLAQDIPFGFSISATSRLPRGAEQDGVDYYFLTKAAFREKIAQNAFLEYEEVYSGNFYGTLRTEVERLWASAKHVLFDIEVVGGLNIKQQFPEECLALFVQPPSLEELEKRLRGRGTDSEETIQHGIPSKAIPCQWPIRNDQVPSQCGWITGLYAIENSRTFANAF